MLGWREERVIPEWLVVVELAVPASWSAALVIAQHSHFPCPANCMCATTRLLLHYTRNNKTCLVYVPRFRAQQSQLQYYRLGICMMEELGIANHQRK
jgi:hypothetical protein